MFGSARLLFVNPLFIGTPLDWKQQFKVLCKIYKVVCLKNNVYEKQLNYSNVKRYFVGFAFK